MSTTGSALGFIGDVLSGSSCLLQHLSVILGISVSFSGFMFMKLKVCSFMIFKFVLRRDFLPSQVLYVIVT